MKAKERLPDEASSPATPPGPGQTPDPDFDDPLPRIDPDASEFRDQVQVTSYAVAGGLESEYDRERTEAEQATLDALEAMRAMDAGDQVKWRISRSGHEDDSLNGYLETWPNHQMTIERIRDRFGGGTFYCKGFRSGRYFAHKSIQVSGEAKRKPSGVEGVNQSVPVSPQFDAQGFFAAQERRDERRREEERRQREDERRERQEREDREEKRRAERMQLYLTLGPAAIGALGNLFQGRQDNTAALVAALKPPDPLTMLTQLKALQGSGQDGLLNKLLPMLIDMAGSRATGGDTGWLDVIKEFAKGAGPAVGAMIETQVAVARAQAAATGPGTSSLQPTPALPSPSTDNPSATIVVPESVPRRERRTRSVDDPSRVGWPESPSRRTLPAGGGSSVDTVGARSLGGDMSLIALLPHLPWLREMLAGLYMAASRGKDPEVYAALFIEELPEGLDRQQVWRLLSAQDWFSSLCQLEPRWTEPRVYNWIVHVRELIVRALAPSPAPETARETVTPAATPAVTVSAAPAVRHSGEVDRPTRLPSLTGD